MSNAWRRRISGIANLSQTSRKLCRCTWYSHITEHRGQNNCQPLFFFSRCILRAFVVASDRAVYIVKLFFVRGVQTIKARSNKDEMFHIGDISTIYVLLKVSTIVLIVECRKWSIFELWRNVSIVQCVSAFFWYFFAVPWGNTKLCFATTSSRRYRVVVMCAEQL